MKLYDFDGVTPALELVPLAARRALDAVGLKVSLATWQKLPLPLRCSVAEAGSQDVVDPAFVQGLRDAGVDLSDLPRREEPASATPPKDLLRGLGRERPLPDALWASLSALDRYVLVKVAERGNAERLTHAYGEIVGASAVSTHLAPRGGVRMIDVAEKPVTWRRAVATSRVKVNEDAMQRLAANTVPKGDVLGTARLAGIMAAKRTAELIPLCHPLHLTRVAVDLKLEREQGTVQIEAQVEAMDRTGVEMEALTAASVAALTVYDMLKAFDRTMDIGPTRLVAKSGGKSGDFQR